MDLARFGWDNTVYYRERYSQAGFTRKDLLDPLAFNELPITTKRDLRDRKSEFVVPGNSDAFRLTSSTGGSTGEPLTLFHDQRAPVAAMWWRVYRWWGIHQSDNKAFIQRERRSNSERARERLEWWPTEQIYLDARTLSRESMDAFLVEWRRNKPRLLNGYVGAVHEFASYLLANGLRVPAPVAIGVTAAPITPPQRNLIESTLGAPVYDQYRSAEIPWIAAQCSERSALHVLSDIRVVELVAGTDAARGGENAAGPPGVSDGVTDGVTDGVEGEIVVTDLCNRVFPLIRYAIGDRSSIVPEPCPCGMTLTRIAPIAGRVSDVIRLPNGQSITGGLTGLFNDYPDAVRQFQIHQLADYSIVLRYALGPAPDAESKVAAAAATLSAIVHSSVPVTLERVDHIAHDRGKARVVLSDLTPSAGGAAS